MTRPGNANLKKELGRRLYKFRKRLGYSQVDVAAECKLHWTYISGLERGERNPTLTTLKRIAEGLKVGIPTLVDGLVEEKTPPLSQREKNLRLAMKWLQRGNEAEVAMALNVVRVIIQETRKARQA